MNIIATSTLMSITNDIDRIADSLEMIVVLLMVLIMGKVITYVLE